MSQRVVAAEIECAYEAVRAQATGTTMPVTPRGLALIIDSGLPAWIRAWSPLAHTQVTLVSAPAIRSAPQSAELVSVIAEMALGRRSVAWTT